MLERKELLEYYNVTDGEIEHIFEMYCTLAKKSRGELTTKFEDILLVHLLDLVSRIAMYCNREDMPIRVHSILAKMLYGVCPWGALTSTDADVPVGDKEVKKVSVGRATVDYGATVSGAAALNAKEIDELFATYALALSMYRRPGVFHLKRHIKDVRH